MILPGLSNAESGHVSLGLRDRGKRMLTYLKRSQLKTTTEGKEEWLLEAGKYTCSLSVVQGKVC